MSALSLESAQATARATALFGDASGFESQMQAVVSLDREGRVDMRSMRMLRVVARARLADLAGVDETLHALDPLSPTEWREILAWLRQAPDMEHPAYSTFVHSLDQRMRRHTGISRWRRLTPMLAVMLVASVASLLVLMWRLAPRDAARDTQASIHAVLHADPQALTTTLPASWVGAIRLAADTMSSVTAPGSAAAFGPALDALALALRDASRSPNAGSLARLLLGPIARAEDLARLAESVTEWKSCPWLDVSQWGRQEAWTWKPSPQGLLAWRCLLRHAPLAAWTPGWFINGWRVDPLDPVDPRVRRAAADDQGITLTVQMGSDAWPIPVIRQGRWWVPPALASRWDAVRASMAPDRLGGEHAASLQSDIVAAIEGVTRWIRDHGEGRSIERPQGLSLTWWVP
ncbi:MAG: hypothetical protein ACO32J_04265 [Phycisphaerales bacterium]